MEKILNSFVVFILTHGRPDNVLTYKTLRESGYTGKIYLIIDNEDKTAKDYYLNFGTENVIMFDKLAESKKFDTFDNFDNRKTIVYARNACFDIAEKLGYKYFLQLDDDYGQFKFRINGKGEHPINRFKVKTLLDDVFDITLKYFISIDVKSIAFSQGGDWFGGEQQFGKIAKRKCMNTFFCSTDRRFNFVGRINEDVNTYTWFQSLGNIFFSIPFIQIDQLMTQTNKSGMSEVYLDSGTYLKSFYTIICSPNCTHISIMGTANKRLHHSINWDNAVPCIIDEQYKK